MLFIASIVFTSLEAYAYFYKTPLYRGDTTLLLIKQTDSSDSITQNDITLNQKLVSTYSQIVKSRRVLDQVITNLNLNYSVGQLSSKVEVTSVQNTEIIKISVIDESNEMAAFIANTVAEVFTKEIVDIYKIENVSIIDKAIVSSEPYNISVVKDSIVYAIVGVVVAFGVIAVILYFDTSVKSVSDIENRLNLPVLGTVPKVKRKKR